MRLYNWSHNRFNLIKRILYYNLYQDKPLINHLSFDLPNLFGQSSKSTI